MAAKPTSLPRWATGGGAGVTEPTEGKKDTGWLFLERPAHEYLNWLLNLVYLWVVYLDDIANIAWTWTVAHIFQRGITVTQATTNGAGVTATGNGTGVGGAFTGGGSSGTGLTATGGSSNGIGVVAQGTGSGQGLWAIGGSTSPAVIAAGAGGAAAVRCTSGGVEISATPPTSSGDPGVNHLLTSANITKAWVRVVTDGVGGYTILDGYNIASCTLNAAYVTVTFTRAFANVNYSIAPGLGSSGQINYDRLNITTTTARMVLRDSAGNVSDPTAGIFDFSVHFNGRQ